MHSYVKLILAASFCAATALADNVPAKPADKLTLSDAVNVALENNPELLAARKRIEAATGRAIQARLLPNPELELSADDVPSKGGGLSQSKNMIGLVQTVPFPGKQSLDARIASQETTAVGWEYRSRERGLVREVTCAFWQILAAEKKLAVTEELVALARSLADASRQRAAAGEAPAQEQLRAEIELERVTAELSATRQVVAFARQELAALFGRPGEPLGELRGELAVTASDRGAASLVGHPDALAAQAQRQRAELELRRAKLEPLPDVTFGVAAGRDRAANETMMEFRVALPLPLFDRALGRKREAQALSELARFDAEATMNRLTRDLAQAQARLLAVSEQVESYRTRIVPKAEESLRLVRGGFDAGKFAFLDVVDTQRTLAEARLGYLDKLLELNLAVADLEALAGTQPKK